MWHRVENIEKADSGDITAECRIPSKSQWFTGHFPSQPILPGIAQLALVRETVHRGCNKPVTGCDFSRVKFKQMITPGEHLTIVAVPKKDGAYAFRILVNNEVVSSGQLTMKTDKQ